MAKQGEDASLKFVEGNVKLMSAFGIFETTCTKIKKNGKQHSEEYKMAIEGFGQKGIAHKI